MVDVTISYIFCPLNVSYTSWETKAVLIDGVRIEMPTTTRKISLTHMYANYISESSDIPKENQIKRAIFFSFSFNVNACRFKAKKGTWLCRGFSSKLQLCYYATVSWCFLPSYTRCIVEFHAELEVARRYLKYGVNAQIEPNGCIAHTILFCLSATDKEETREVADCVGCKHIFFLLDHLKIVGFYGVQSPFWIKFISII